MTDHGTAHLALLDRILAALVEAPATAAEVAERIGTVACGQAGGPLGCCVHPSGWRPARSFDVEPDLDLLARHGLVKQVGARWERLAPDIRV